MQTTIFLAQIWGPILLALGFGFFISREFYIKIYRDLEKERFAALIFGMTSMAAGLIQVNMHNEWDNLLESVVSLLGWGLLLKGMAFLIVPQFADRMGDWAINSKLLPFIGAFLLIAGVSLFWIGYILV